MRESNIFFLNKEAYSVTTDPSKTAFNVILFAHAQGQIQDFSRGGPEFDIYLTKS